jgi:nucleotide-binding universal stress UspA family protein
MEEKTGKYLVCVDASESSRVALHFACKKALKRGGTVELLHVVPKGDMQNLFGVGNKMREEQRQEAEILLKSLSESAFQYSGITPTVQIREGRLGEEILEAALADHSVNMLVLGASPESADKGHLVNWLAGKLGDRLLVPLMLVPGNLTDLQIDELS